MNAAQLLALTIVVIGCGPTVSEVPSPSLITPDGQATTTTAHGTPSAASASQAVAGGVFVFTPGVMDCPGNPGGLCPSYTVAEAIGQPRQPGIPIIVRGHVLIQSNGTAWYCDALTDSAPPRCAGERLAFDGLDLIDPAMFEELDGTRWSEEVQLLGEVTP